MKNLKIRETTDYEKLVPFFIENELEFSEDEPVPTDNVKCWEVTDEDGRLLAGAVLAIRQGEYICDGLAIDPSLRGCGMGRALMETVINEAGKRGGKRVYIVAKAPEVFKAIGYVSIKREEAPNFFECFTCPRYEKECHPQVMRFDIGKSNGK